VPFSTCEVVPFRAVPSRFGPQKHRLSWHQCGTNDQPRNPATAVQPGVGLGE
jgi:hypothetical protein